MKNKSDNNTWAVITRKSIFVDAPSETYYFKKLDEAKQFLNRTRRLPLGCEQAQLVKIMQWHEQEENCTDYHTAIGQTYQVGYEEDDKDDWLIDQPTDEELWSQC